MDAHRFDVAGSVAFTVCGEEGHVISDGIFLCFFVLLFILPGGGCRCGSMELYYSLILT